MPTAPRSPHGADALLHQSGGNGETSAARKRLYIPTDKMAMKELRDTGSAAFLKIVVMPLLQAALCDLH